MLFAGLAWYALVVAEKAPSASVRLLWRLAVLPIAAVVLGGFQRLAVQAVRVGWLPGDTLELLLDEYQIVQSVVVAGIGIVTLFGIRRLAVRFNDLELMVGETGGLNPGWYAYDANGNTVSMPGATLTWSGDNRLETITTGGVTVSYGLDALGRSLTHSDGTTTSSYHYGGDGDAAGWVVDGATTTRYVPGPAGLSAVHVVGGSTTWLLTSPHGDVWAHTNTLGDVTATFRFDEYGVVLDPSTGNPALDRYGWLGSQQRETDPTTGLIMMGVRVYDPTLGRFLTVDPVHGGSANNYEYTAGDPINNYDLDGQRKCKSTRDRKCTPTFWQRLGRVWNAIRPSVIPNQFSAGIALAASGSAMITSVYTVTAATGGGAIGVAGGALVASGVGLAIVGLAVAGYAIWKAWKGR